MRRLPFVWFSTAAADAATHTILNVSHGGAADPGNARRREALFTSSVLLTEFFQNTRQYFFGPCFYYANVAVTDSHGGIKYPKENTFQCVL